jgi:uncharacterized damage-inducible protein DinB
VPAAVTSRPDSTEYSPYYGKYVEKVPQGDLLQILERERRETLALLRGLTETQALHRYAPGKWSIKEVVGHVNDSERIFAYRALRIGRGDTTPLASFDQDTYVPAGAFDARPVADLAAEYDAIRGATLALLRSFDEAALARRGTASGKEVSARGLAWIIAGHARHHFDIVRERYLVGGNS